MDKGLRTKITLIYVFLILGFAIVIARLAYINVVDGERLRAQVEVQKRFTRDIPYERGMILDSKGEKLAYSITEYQVSIENPEDIPRDTFDEIIAHLAEVLEMSEEEIRAKQKGNNILIVTKSASRDQRININPIYNNYLWIDALRKRYYPNGSLAADILGRSRIDDDTLRIKGTYGIERLFNEALIGSDGSLSTQSDKRDRELVYNDRREIAEVNGDTIQLTIDTVIQHYVEQALEAAFVEHRPKAAHALVMDVNTGEILAMASYPTFDPGTNEIIGIPKDEMDALSYDEKWEIIMSTWRNDMVQSTYELGSTLKLITAAIALEESVATPDTKFNLGNNIQVADRNIKCWYYPQSHGEETLTQAVENSCNPVFVKLGQMIGKDVFYDYYVDFGLNERTDVDLYDEAYPITFDRDRIHETELATMTFGHGVSQTPIQVAAALSAVVNGGYLLEPHIVKRIIEPDGMVDYEATRTVKRQVISEITSVQMRQIMESVVENGSGSSVQIDGYRIGGKTGTSEKAINGTYSKDKAIASFVAVAPIDEPEILVYVVIDEPSDSIFGSKVAGPITRNILLDTLDYLEIDKVFGTSTEYTEVPELTGLTILEARELLEVSGFKTTVVTDDSYDDESVIVDQYPKAGSSREIGSTILIEIDE
ncbi:MAG: PASTA domain-containing protein [Clostridiales bacterium]|nr:PASTA domain-containing protein [Clostridiales bacterium]